MRTQLVDGHYEWVRRQISVHTTVENDDAAVFCSGAKQRVPQVEPDVPIPFTAPYSLVRFVGKLQVKPREAPVVRSDNDVVAGGVHAHAAQLFETTNQIAHHALLHQVVNLHPPAQGDKQYGLCGMKPHALGVAFVLRKRALRGEFRQLVHKNGSLVALRVESGKIVAFCVP